MAFVQADLDAVNKAIASGELEVEFSGPNGSRVRYRSMDDLLKARKVIIDELSAAAGNRRSRAVQTIYSKGL